MIINLRLKNFFSLADEVVLDFTAISSPKSKRERLPQNLIKFNGDDFVNIIGIFGGNAAGKSNLIKAVNFCRDLILNSHLNNENSSFDFEPFKFEDGKPSEFAISFVAEGIEYEYSFSLTKERILSESLYYYPLKRKAKVFCREDSNIYSYGKGQMSRPAEIEANTGPRTLFLSRASSMNREIARTVYRYFRHGITIEESIDRISELRIEDIERNKELLLRALEISDSDIIDIRAFELQPGKPLLQTFHRENPTIPFDFIKEESEGTRRLVLILLLLIEEIKSDTTIFYDEFDLKLHLKLTEFLLDVVRESKSSQLVFTSHNPLLISRESLRDEQIVFVTKLPDGSSEFIPLSDYKGGDKIADISKAYLQGRFDGIPYIGSATSLLEEE